MRMAFRVNWGNRSPQTSYDFELPSKEFPEGRAFVYSDRVWSAFNANLGYESRSISHGREESGSWTTRRERSWSWSTGRAASKLNVNIFSEFSKYRFVEVIEDQIQVKRDKVEQEFIPPVL